MFERAKRPPLRLRRVGCWGLLVLLILLIAVTAMPAWALWRAYQAADAAKIAVGQARGYAGAGSYEEAAINVANARAHIAEARAALGDVGFWRDMPGTGTQLRALEDAAGAADQGLDAAHGLLEAADAVAQAFQANAYAEIDQTIAPTRSYDDLSPEEKRDVLRRLNAALPAMRVARDKASLALELWQRVPQDRLVGPLATALKPLAEGLPVMKDALDRSIPLIEGGLPFAGYPNKARYLVLFQNSDELRPTGGFIGSLAMVAVDGGDLKGLDFSDVYTVDNAVTGRWKDQPPSILARELGVKAWYLRDANWSPDFPSSAARVLDVFHRETAMIGLQGEQPTAVIAFTPAFFASVLTLTGPVTVDGTTYDAGNFFDKVQYQVEQGFLKQGTKLEDRKAVLGRLGTALVDKLKHLPSSRWGEALDLVSQSFERKQIQAYAEDRKTLATLDANGWTGRAASTNGDFLWAIDANLAALKTDGVMAKSITYSLDARHPGEAPLATVTFDYVNTNKKIDWRYTRYRSYTRLYVPEGSELVSSSGGQGATDVFKDLGKTVFGSFWTIEPGDRGTLTFTYRVSPDVAAQIAAGTYRLDWPKQAGADKTRLTVDLKFGKNIGAADPAEAREKWGDAAYQLTTDSLVDRSFSLKLQP